MFSNSKFGKSIKHVLLKFIKATQKFATVGIIKDGPVFNEPSGSLFYLDIKNKNNETKN